MSVSPIHTKIWLEEPEVDNPFATRAAYCHGYDVYGQMLGKAGWADMVFLLFRGEAPDATQAQLLTTLAVALANPGPRDPAVHAAMCGGVGGSTAASSLMAALAVGAGQCGGAREVYLAMQAWVDCGMNLPRWQHRIASPPWARDDVWPVPDHPIGFDPRGVTTSTLVRQALDALACLLPGARLSWLQAHREALESAAQRPVAFTLVVATALADLGFSAQEGEMLHLILRLPGAAAHALEQAHYGFKRFPFPRIELEDAPA
ncbi:MAG: citryl-CoA lyase [Pseudomonadota bacterium]